jgi:diaminopimelate dehydrogenase
LLESTDFELAGMVQRPQSATSLPRELARVPLAQHLRDLGRIDVALLCVPAGDTAGVARDTLQQRTAIVECAMLEGALLQRHHAAIDESARHHRTVAVVGAGWNPGALPLMKELFGVLIPLGHTESSNRPAVSLHHTATVEGISGVSGALTSEYRGSDGTLTRYVYVELASGARLGTVRAAIESDPMFAGERTLVFEVPSLAALEAEGHGLVLERLGTARHGSHQTLLLEGRFEVPAFAARVMLDAARHLPSLKPGAHPYSLWTG